MSNDFPQFLASFMLNDLKGMLKKHNKKIEDVDTDILKYVVVSLYQKNISRDQARRFISVQLKIDKEKLSEKESIDFLTELKNIICK